jgi:hypothetical protein
LGWLAEAGASVAFGRDSRPHAPDRFGSPRMVFSPVELINLASEKLAQ